MMMNRTWIKKEDRNPTSDETRKLRGAFRTRDEDGRVFVRYFDDTDGTWWSPPSPDNGDKSCALVSDESFTHWLLETMPAIERLPTKKLTVREIIKRWLGDNGYDGLCHPESECGCRLSDLAPCCEAIDDCEPAHEVMMPDDPEGFGFRMHTEKPGSGD